jgi:hypothetical protein
MNIGNNILRDLFSDRMTDERFQALIQATVPPHLTDEEFDNELRQLSISIQATVPPRLTDELRTVIGDDNFEFLARDDSFLARCNDPVFVGNFIDLTHLVGVDGMMRCARHKSFIVRLSDFEFVDSFIRLTDVFGVEDMTRLALNTGFIVRLINREYTNQLEYWYDTVGRREFFRRVRKSLTD